MAERSTPADEVIRRWHEEGLTRAEMRQRWYEESDKWVTPNAFSMRLKRMGIDPSMARHTDLIPWVTATVHSHNYYVQMLRLVSRARIGDPSLTPELAEKGLRWEARLNLSNLVVCYRPETEQGFWLVEREPKDRDIIREP